MVVYTTSSQGSRDLVLMDKLREDGAKLQIILQFLESRGLLKTIAQLEEEAGITFSESVVKEGGVLDAVLDEYLAKLAEPLPPYISPFDDLPSPSVCVTDVYKTIHDIHGPANPTCVAWHPVLENVVVSGGVDRKLIFRDIDSESILHQILLPSPVLCLDWVRPDQLVAGCMGGEVVFVTENGEIISVQKPHTHARISSVLYSPDGAFVATCGKDISVRILRSQDQSPVGTIRCMREVSSICWIDANSLVVAESDNPLLGVYRLQDGKMFKIGQLCMNLHLYDPLTANSTLAMSFDPGHHLLLACTTRNSVLLFQLLDDWREALTPIKTYYGMSIGIYDVPWVAFSLDASFVYATSDKEILVLETKTGHKVFTIKVSDSKPVRCMRRHQTYEAISTVSFDKKLNALK